MGNRLRPNRKTVPKPNNRKNILGGTRRPIITKRKQQNDNPIKQGALIARRPKPSPPISQKPAANPLSVFQGNASSYDPKQDKVNLLDTPRSHNPPAKDVPKVRYQSIILEEPVDPQDDAQSKEASDKKQLRATLTDGDKDSKLPKSSSVNYGYHPIIDFFPRYRFDASRK